PRAAAPARSSPRRWWSAGWRRSDWPWSGFALPRPAAQRLPPLRGSGARALRLFFLPLLAEAGIQDLLAQADRLGGHLDQLVVLDVGDRLFEGHAAGRGEADGLVLASGADVGQLLALQRVHVQIVGAGILADDHALVARLAAAHEHHAAVFQVPQGVGHRL